MRKLSEAQWKYQIRRSEKGTERRTRKKFESARLRHTSWVRRQDFAKATGLIEFHELANGTWIDSKGIERPCLKLRAPCDFRYSHNAKEIMSFVYTLRREAILNRRMSRIQPRNRKPLYVDLDGLQKLDLEGALILAAEMDRIKRTFNMKPSLDDGGWAPHIRSMLYEFGLYDLIDARRVDSTVPIHDIKPLLEQKQLIFKRFISGNDVDGALPDELQNSLVAEDPALKTNRAQL